jgi:hypothetical protein
MNEGEMKEWWVMTTAIRARRMDREEERGGERRGEEEEGEGGGIENCLLGHVALLRETLPGQSLAFFHVSSTLLPHDRHDGDCNDADDDDESRRIRPTLAAMCESVCAGWQDAASRFRCRVSGKEDAMFCWKGARSTRLNGCQRTRGL